jgi:hypothetical protein
MKKTTPAIPATSKTSTGRNLRLQRTTLRRLTLPELSKVGAGLVNCPPTGETTGVVGPCNTIWTN